MKVRNVRRIADLGDCVHKLFEEAIDKEMDDGFELESWQFTSVSMDESESLDTIIAVFVKEEEVDE